MNRDSRGKFTSADGENKRTRRTKSVRKINNEMNKLKGLDGTFISQADLTKSLKDLKKMTESNNKLKGQILNLNKLLKQQEQQLKNFNKTNKSKITKLQKLQNDQSSSDMSKKLDELELKLNQYTVPTNIIQNTSQLLQKEYERYSSSLKYKLVYSIYFINDIQYLMSMKQYLYLMYNIESKLNVIIYQN